MPIDIDIAHVARLARLALSEDDAQIYHDQLGDILDHAAKVQALDTDGVEPTAHPLPLTNAFRDDRARPGLDIEAVMQSAPDRHERYFRVPPALEVE